MFTQIKWLILLEIIIVTCVNCNHYIENEFIGEWAAKVRS